MAVFITNDCINCSACEAECPMNAVLPKLISPDKNSVFINNKFLAKPYQSFDHYYVNPNKCNNCNGFYSAPRCNEVCPVSCCILIESDDFLNECKTNVKVNPAFLNKLSLN